MSEQPKPEKKITHTLIPQDSMVTIEASGFFIQRIQRLLLHYCNLFGKEKLIEIFDNIKNEKEAESFEEEALAVLLALVNEFEKKAIEQKKTEKITLSESELEQYVDKLKSII